MTKRVLAAGPWRDNGEMMADVARLYIPKNAQLVLDVTFGEGAFWSDFRPDNLVGTDIVLDKSPGWEGGCDFRDLPFLDGCADVTVFDPAYVSTGGRETSTLTSMIDEYAMHSTEKTPQAQWSNVIRPGIAECVRVTRGPVRGSRRRGRGRSGGLVMVKAMNYISSGQFHNFQTKVSDALEELGCRLIDQFVLTRRAGGPQPGGRTKKCPACKGTGIGEEPDPTVPTAQQQTMCGECNDQGRVPSRQVHAANNVSYLIVGRKR